MADLSDVLPLGYPTEQFLVWTRNDVQENIEQSKRERKEHMAKLKRANIDDGAMAGVKDNAILKREEDGGLVSGASGNLVTKSFPMILQHNCKTRAKCSLVDKLFNAIRYTIKETSAATIRAKMEFPKRTAKGLAKARPSLSSNEPATEINSVGYNPSLQRRLLFKQVPMFSKKGKMEFINIYYIYDHPDFSAAYRCDHEKYEEAGKLLVAPNETTTSKEEFTPCETSYKMVRQIMLWKKFETMYTEGLLGKDDEEEGGGNAQERINQAVDKEEKRMAKVRNGESFKTKEMLQSFEEKNNFIKMMRGPYYKLMSGNGLVDDNFITCAQQDLIDYATAETPRVLILGKPRSGKTTCQRSVQQS
jgi:hypothetical protein